MDKGQIFVIAYSIVLLILFGVSCFLMTIVNPDPIAGNSTNTTSTKAPEAPSTPGSPDDNPDDDGRRSFHGNSFLKDIVIPLDGTGKLGYGLEKIIPLGTDINAPIVINLDVEAKYIPVNDSLNQSNTEDSDDNNNTMKTLSVKGQRRSINDNVNGPSGYGLIILKILDYAGLPRVEIDIDTNGFHNKTPSSECNELKTNNSKLDDYVTFVKIMPNKTIFFDKIQKSAMRYFVNS